MFGIPLEPLVIVFAVGVGLLYSNWSKKETDDKVAGSSPSLNLGGINDNVKKMLVPLLILVGVLILFFFWGPIRDGIAGWFVTTDMNTQIGLEEETVKGWFWVLPFLIMAGFWLMRGNKGPKKPSSLNSSDLVFAAFVLAVIAIFWVGVTGGINFVDDARENGLNARERAGTVAGWFDSNGDRPECNLKDYLRANNGRIPTAGAIVTICPGDGRAMLLAQPRANLNYQWFPAFQIEHSVVLNGRSMDDFITLQRGGGVRDSYQLTVNDAGFVNSGLNSIVLFIQSDGP